MSSTLKLWSGAVLASTVLTLGSVPAIAQVAPKATITGTVRDAADAVVPGANVELKPLGIKAVSDDQGACSACRRGSGRLLQRYGQLRRILTAD